MSKLVEFCGANPHPVHRTHRPEVIGIGAMVRFQLPSGYQEPVLVSGTDSGRYKAKTCLSA